MLLRGKRRVSQGTEVCASDPRSFFFGIARNVLKETRKATREVPTDPVALDMRPASSRDFELVENRRALRQVLQQLRPEERRLRADPPWTREGSRKRMSL